MASDPELLALGWRRRSLSPIDQVEGLRRQYEEIGFEVLERPLTPRDFDPSCAACAEDAAQRLVVLYTRSRR